MLDNEILEEIIDSSLKGKHLTKLQIQKIVTKRIEDLDYISKNKYNGLIFGKDSDWGNSAFATFNIETGIITFNINRICKEQKLVKHTILTQNLETLTIVLHEIEHLRETYKSTKNNLEGAILRFNENKTLESICEQRIRQIYNKSKPKHIRFNDILFNIYNDIYDINPFERIAEISASKLVLDSISNYPNFKSNCFGSYNYIKNKYIKDLCSGYKLKLDGKTNCMLFDYFATLKSASYFKRLISSNFPLGRELDDLENKMKLGFRITSDEYYKIQNKTKIMLKTK